jgi:hypothetical protein
MKKMISYTTLLFCMFGKVFATEYLVRLDASAATSFQVIELVDDHALMIADDEMLKRLEQQGCLYAILDENPRDKFYVFVFPVAEELTNIARFGRILDQYDDCVLLQTKQDRLPDLNRLRVELSRLTLKPIVRRERGAHDFGKIPVTRDTLIEQMLEDVNPDSILNNVLRMQHFYTRYAMSDSNKIAAVNWIKDRFMAYGCDSVYTQTFSGIYGDNVVGIRIGEKNPSLQNYVLIGAHLDDVPSFDYAPGADDNGSGVAAVFEALRVLKNYRFARTIRFAAFNAEEQGLIGSDSLASFASSQNDTIIAALCYDMIGYVTDSLLDTMRIRYTTAVPGCSLFACDFYQTVADTYTQLKIRPVRYTGTTGSSDHASFWQYGYVSTGGIERVLCPGYHTTGDTIGPTGFNDLEFATQVIKTAIAALATIAVPVDSGTAVDELSAFESFPLFVVKPNPGDRFDISFTVEKDFETIDLTVYDCTGRYVSRLASGSYHRGIYSHRWEGTDAVGSAVTPGVYFVTLTRDSHRQSRKIVLLN